MGSINDEVPIKSGVLVCVASIEAHNLIFWFRSMRTEVEELRNQLEAQTLAVNRLTGERDALLQQSSGELEQKKTRTFYCAFHTCTNV